MADNKKSSITLQENSNKFQVITYFFDCITSDNVSFNSNITDNWVENNTAIQDHIALSPVTISLKGLCGDKIYEAEQAELDYYTELAQAQVRNAIPIELANFGEFGSLDDIDGKLSAIGSLFPSVSNITQMAQNMWHLHQASVKRATKIANILTGKSAKGINSQMNAYSGANTNISNKRLKQIGNDLKMAWESRKSFIVSTPFGDFDNMYIQSVSLRQENELYAGDIEVTLKQIRFAETLTTKVDEEVRAKYNAYAQSLEQNYGSSGGENSRWYNKYASGVEYKNR